MEIVKYESEAAWKAEGIRRFGPDVMKWKFRCPVCGHVASVQDWMDAGAGEGEVAFSCVGRHHPDPERKLDPTGMPGRTGGPCDYAGGGLFRLNPVEIAGKVDRLFDFADREVPHG